MNKRKGCLGQIALASAVLLVILTAITLPMASLARNAEGQLFSSESLTNYIESHIISSGFIRNLITRTVFQDEALGSLNQYGIDFSQAFIYLSDEDRQEMVDRLLPEDWLTGQVEQVLEGTLNWLENDKTRPDWHLDLAPLRDNLLRGGGAASIAEITVDSWPECNEEDIQGMLEFVEGVRDQPPLCEPPEPLRYEIIVVATQLLRGMAEDIPMQLQLGEELGGDLDPASVQTLKNTVAAIRRLADASILLPWTFLGLIMALVIRSWELLLRWWGTAIGLGGIVGLMTAYRLSGIQEDRLSSILDDLRRGMPELANLIGELISGMVSRILEQFALESLISAILGAAAVLVAWLIKRRRGPALPLQPAKSTPAPGEGMRSQSEPPMDPGPPPEAPLQDAGGAESEDPPSGMYA